MEKYSELLKDRRWIHKRQQIIKRDNNKCTACPSTTNLQVHHTYYYNEFTEPWNYPDESLITVCKACHQYHHEHSEIEYRDKPVFNKKKKKKNLKIKKIVNPIIYKKKICLADIQSKREIYKRRISV